MSLESLRNYKDIRRLVILAPRTRDRNAGSLILYEGSYVTRDTLRCLACETLGTGTGTGTERTMFRKTVKDEHALYLLSRPRSHIRLGLQRQPWQGLVVDHLSRSARYDSQTRQQEKQQENSGQATASTASFPFQAAPRNAMTASQQRKEEKGANLWRMTRDLKPPLPCWDKTVDRCFVGRAIGTAVSGFGPITALSHRERRGSRIFEQSRFLTMRHVNTQTHGF